MDNVEVVRAIEDAYNRKDYRALDSLIAADLSAHTPGSEMMPDGPEGAKTADMGRRVRSRTRGPRSWTSSGRRTGWSPSLHDRHERRRAAVVRDPSERPEGGHRWIQISRHAEDGRVVETWAQMDIPRLMMQLGAMPGGEA